MTPKAKAEEILYKYAIVIGGVTAWRFRSKMKALKEVIGKILDFYDSYPLDKDGLTVEYWVEVKKELEAL